MATYKKRAKKSRSTVIQKNIEFYSSNPRLSFQTRLLSRMSEDRKVLIFKKAEEFLETHTQS